MTTIFRFRLTDRPGVWLTMIDPARPDLAAARESLELRFGTDRVLEVIPV